MKTMTVFCTMLIALVLAFGVAAEQMLKPIHAYRLGDDDQRAVLYYVERGAGHEVVTTWVGEEEVLMRHIAYLEPGQRYTLSLIERGLPVQFTVRNDAGLVVMMGEPEAPAYARLCRGGEETAYPTPLQRLVLCPRGQRIDSADQAPQLTAGGPGSPGSVAISE